MAASAEMLAYVLGLGATAAAAGGFDIPSNINPITQLHRDEMVLPADLANGIRSMVRDGRSNNDRSGHTFNIQAFGPKDAATAVKQALRRGYR
jgi:hypothetical protein